MALTQEEFNRLVQEVTDAIHNKSNDPSQFELATSLQGIESLPVLHQSGGTWTLKRVLISLLKGADGRELELRTTETAFQWRYTGGNWVDLITISKLQEPANEVKDSLQEVIDLWNSTTKLEVEDAISNANTAAANVKDGKTPVLNVLETETLPPGSDADVEQSDGGEDEEGRPVTYLKFKIPAGESGVWIGAKADRPPWARVVIDPTGGATILDNWTTGAWDGVTDLTEVILTSVLYVYDNNGNEIPIPAIEGKQGPPGDISNIQAVTVPFTQAAIRENINTGETIAVLFGKIKKWFADLGTLAFKSTIAWATDITGIPSWIGSTKPSYAYSEITGKPDLTKKADLVDGLIPSTQLPSYVDDVIEGTLTDIDEFKDLDNNVVTPESGKIYVDVATDKQYRWGGSLYTEVSKSLAIGETSESAFAGNRGKDLETGKVDKVAGKGLSTNDFSNDYKNDADWAKTHTSQTAGAVNCATGKDFTITASGALTLSLSNLSSIIQGSDVTIRVIGNDATERTITLPTTGVENETGIDTAVVTSTRSLELNIKRFGSTYVMKGTTYEP